MSFLNISAAMDGLLNSLNDLPPVAWENLGYKPEKGTLYLRPTLITGDTVQSSLGTNGQDRHIGVYQVDVFSDAGKGKNEAIVMADNIADLFKRGTTATYDGQNVVIIQPSRGVSATTDGWYQIPVTITYRANTTARA